MRIKDHTDMVRHLTDPFNIPEARRMIQQNPALTQEQFKEGGRIGFQRGSGNPIQITDQLLNKLDRLIKTTNKTLKQIGRDLGYAADLRSDSYLIKAYEKKHGKLPSERFKSYKLANDPEYVRKVVDEVKKSKSIQATAEKLDVDRKTVKNILNQEAPHLRGKTNIAGPETGAKELKKRRIGNEKDLIKYWKGQKGGELVLKQYYKKLKDIKAENKSILKMSDDAIWNNKKFKDAMQLNVKKLKAGEGLKFDRYPDISKKDFVKKVKDLADKGQFVQPEHSIPLHAKNPDSLLAKNIFPAYGKVGGQMEVLKTFSVDNTIGKRPTEVFNFLKSQNIPIEKPGLWKATKKYALKPLGNVAGKVFNVGLGPTGLIGLNAALGVDPTQTADRIGIEGEAAFAKPLVKGALSVTDKIKTPLLRKIAERASLAAMSPAMALRLARIASPIGIASLGIEGLYHVGKAGYNRYKLLEGMDENQKREFLIFLTGGLQGSVPLAPVDGSA